MNEKTNRKPPEQPPQPPQAPPTLKCFLVPVEQMEIIRDALREAPYKTAAPVVQGLATLQTADVPIAPQQPPG